MMKNNTNTNSPLWLVLAGFIIAAIAAFSHFIIFKNYIVFANVVCNPSEHSCFIGDGETTPVYFKEIARPAYSIPICAWRGECAIEDCMTKDLTCIEMYCTEDSEIACSG